MRISDWSSDVCSSDLSARSISRAAHRPTPPCGARMMPTRAPISRSKAWRSTPANTPCSTCCARKPRSEEHTSELQSLMRISYAVFCLKKKIHLQHLHTKTQLAEIINTQSTHNSQVPNISTQKIHDVQPARRNSSINHVTSNHTN